MADRATFDKEEAWLGFWAGYTTSYAHADEDTARRDFEEWWESDKPGGEIGVQRPWEVPGG